ncbi:hypothetical protein M0G74_05515 [Microbulbifer sp. CAU 1566]|uniref:hypothetical protein n=1 Tax=unclassified Microbulbifer TaxID=2619833 RepID=UPI00135AD6DE|nr:MULTISPECIES: hypothetical protein [unclassified Microbulbifer]MCK7596728.1 hypothetical protein [Microbulbifer sp. CAU 1566]
MSNYSAAELWQAIYKLAHYIGEQPGLPIAGVFISAGKSGVIARFLRFGIGRIYGLKLIL